MKYNIDEMPKVIIGDSIQDERGVIHYAVVDSTSDMPCFDCSLRPECVLHQWEYPYLNCSQTEPYHFKILPK